MQVSYNANLQVSEIRIKPMLCQLTQFRDFVTANGTAAQIALMGDATPMAR
jgi:iron complex outermembrane receptor protein